jgi:hypothetical protein
MPSTEEQKRYNKDRRNEKRVDGICLICLVEKAADGHVCCDGCMQKQRDRYDEYVEKGICPNCLIEPLAVGRKKCSRCLSLKVEKREHDRLIVFNHYGQICAWPDCGVTDRDLLTLDHVNNDGAKERIRDIYSRVIAHGFPAAFQILCWNHQWKKRMLVLRGEQVPIMAQKAGA